MSNLAIRNRLTVGNVWQGGAVALFDRDYAGVLLDLGNVIDSTFDQVRGNTPLMFPMASFSESTLPVVPRKAELSGE